MLSFLILMILQTAPQQVVVIFTTPIPQQVIVAGKEPQRPPLDKEPAEGGRNKPPCTDKKDRPC